MIIGKKVTARPDNVPVQTAGPGNAEQDLLSGIASD